MSTRLERLRGGLVAAICLLLLALSGRAALRDPGMDMTAEGTLPSPEELDSLRPYLAPVEAAPELDDYEAFLPAEAPPAVAAREPEAAPSREGAGPRLGAILISGGSPLAIVDDQPVRPGSRLPGGEEVLTVATDHVVIREPDGTVRALRLPIEGEGRHDG